MQAMPEGGGATGSPATVVLPTVPLMVQPDALAATAARLDAVADKLDACIKGVSPKLAPQPPGSDEVSVVSSAGFAYQGFVADIEISGGTKQLRGAAVNCRDSAQQYQQADESFGSTAAKS